jgi:hypothetical protein
MENTNASEIKKAKKICAGCRDRWALYRWAGRTRWNDKHDLCFRCWGAVMDREQARQPGRPSRAQLVARARARAVRGSRGVSEPVFSEVFLLRA